MRIASSLAIIVLLFATMIGAWFLVVASGLVLLAALVYACFSMRGPERGQYVIWSLVAVVVAGLIGGGIAAIA